MEDNNKNESGLESNKRDHKIEITDIAISKVPFVKYKEIPEEHYKTLQELAKAVLEYSRKRNNCNETAIVYSLDNPDETWNEDEVIAISYGDEHQVKPLGSIQSHHIWYIAKRCVLIILHNHPSLSKVSLQDVSFLFGEASVKMIVVVTNRGSINYIVKTDNYDRIKGMKLFNEATKELTDDSTLKEIQTATDFFLNNCHKAGLIYDDQ